MDDSNSNGVSGSIPKRAAYPSDVNRIPTRLMIENKPLYAAPGHQRRDPIRTLLPVLTTPAAFEHGGQ